MKSNWIIRPDFLRLGFTFLLALTFSAGQSFQIAPDLQEGMLQNSHVSGIPYMKGRAIHILPGTHNNESGYFSLSVGRNGRIYVGTAKYDVNAYLVEFDPATEGQQIVLDVNQLCEVSDSGYMSQAKIHTFNYIDSKGVIYMGTKQGFMRPERGDDPWDYPGGFVLSYDPANGQASVLGQVPFKGHGVSDVVYDEKRKKAYVTTCEDTGRLGLWYELDPETGSFKGIGPLTSLFSTTVINQDGVAFTITRDCKIASYNPATGKTRERTITCNGNPVQYSYKSVQYMVMAKDRQTAYFIDMQDARLYEFDLSTDQGDLQATDRGKMLRGEALDVRPNLHFGPDGKIYTAILRKEKCPESGQEFSLNHIVCYDPNTNLSQDLGVLTVENDDFFDFSQVDTTRYPYHGFRRLPDGTLAPVQPCLALDVSPDGTLYCTTLYPFSLIRVKLSIP
ncbi:MAG: hypothetical protein ABFS28_14380 [Bacteroidota bacterium]